MVNNRIMTYEFIQNKYTKWYYAIIDKRRLNCPDGYVEKHHIIPTSLGGSNDLNNVIKLTAREHVLCHRFLTRMTLGLAKHKMIHALWMMSHRLSTFVTSTEYERLRIQKSNAMKDNCIAAGKHSPERIEQNRQAQKLAHQRPEVRAKYKAVRLTPEFKAAQSAGSKRSMARQEVRDKIANAHKRSVVQKTPAGEFVAEFDSGKEAERITKISRCHICRVAKGNRDHAGGFKWEYVENIVS